MTRAPIKADGEIDGVYVVGFHGSVAPDRTPAMKAPLYVDAAGRLCAVVDRDPNGQWVALETSETAVVDGRVPGDGTVLTSRAPARLDWGFIVLGRDERAHADALASAMSPTARDRVGSVIAALTDESVISTPRLEKTADGTWAWYCSLASATALRGVIRRAARQAVLRAAHTQDPSVEQLAWWLQRAASDDDDVMLACAALELAGVDRWPAVAQALLPGRDAVWIDEHIQRARDRLGPTTAPAEDLPGGAQQETPWRAAVREVLDRVFGVPGYSAEYGPQRVDVTVEWHRRALSIELDPEARSLRSTAVDDPHAGAARLVLRCPADVPKAELFTAVESWRDNGVATQSYDRSLTYYDATGVDQGRHVASSAA